MRVVWKAWKNKKVCVDQDTVRTRKLIEALKIIKQQITGIVEAAFSKTAYILQQYLEYYWHLSIQDLWESLSRKIRMKNVI